MRRSWGRAADVTVSPRSGGYGPAEWDYSRAPAGQNGLFGWSYYLRAFNLLRETPTQEVRPARRRHVCGTPDFTD